MSAPNNLSSDIINVLMRFIDQLDSLDRESRTRDVTTAVNVKIFPTLFRPKHHSESQITWRQLIQLQENGWLSIENLRKPKVLDDPWVNKRLRLNFDKEADIRSFLRRPKAASAAEMWSTALINSGFNFASIQAAQSVQLNIADTSYEEIVNHLIKAPDIVSQYNRITARQLSSLLFWGMSKVLDGKEQWIRDVFGFSEEQIIERQLLVNVRLSPTDLVADTILIENLDTYLHFAKSDCSDLSQYHLVYCQGFMGSAKRIRNLNYAKFHFVENSNSVASEKFKEAWRSGENIYFWGDLDASGEDIFTALTVVFPDIKKFQPAYDKMNDLIAGGLSHSPRQAGKVGQKNSSPDDRFLDQESVISIRKQGFITTSTIK